SVTWGRSVEYTKSNPESPPATAVTPIKRTKRALPKNVRPPLRASAGGVVTTEGSSTSRFMAVGARHRIALKSMVRAVAGLALLLIRTGLRAHPTSRLGKRKERIAKSRK